MRTLKCVFMLIATGMIVAAWSAPVEKVLQNGLNGYSGCVDAFVLSKAGYETENYGNHDSLELRWDDG